MNFYKSNLCTSLSYCATCRRTCSNGVSWRKKALLDSGDTLENINFDCPLGCDWIDKNNFTEKNRSDLFRVAAIRRERSKLKTNVESKKSVVTRALSKYRVGDKIARVTNALGIEPCGGCKKRQAILNGENLTGEV